MKKSKAHQEAIDAKERAERRALGNYHALVAAMAGKLQPVGSVIDDGDSYDWRAAYSPRMRDAVIVETFHGATETATRVFWLDDIRHGMQYASSEWQSLYSRAVQMQNAEWDKERQKIA